MGCIDSIKGDESHPALERESQRVYIKSKVYRLRERCLFITVQGLLPLHAV